MGWDTQNTIVAPNGRMVVGVTGRNESLEDVHFIQIKIIEKIEWRANGRKQRKSRCVAESRIYAEALSAWQKLPEMPSRQQRQEWNRYESIAGLERAMTNLLVPDDIRDTYNGALVTIRHTLSVMVVTPNACCTTSPESSVALVVQRQQPNHVAALTDAEEGNVGVAYPANEAAEATALPVSMFD